MWGRGWRKSAIENIARQQRRRVAWNDSETSQWEATEGGLGFFFFPRFCGVVSSACQNYLEGSGVGVVSPRGFWNSPGLLVLEEHASRRALTQGRRPF